LLPEDVVKHDEVEGKGKKVKVFPLAVRGRESRTRTFSSEQTVAGKTETRVAEKGLERHKGRKMSRGFQGTGNRKNEKDFTKRYY